MKIRYKEATTNASYIANEMERKPRKQYVALLQASSVDKAFSDKTVPSSQISATAPGIIGKEPLARDTVSNQYQK